MFSAVDLFSNYAGMKTDLAPWLADAAINRDRNLRLQYLAGMGFNLYQSEAIYADMLQIQPLSRGAVRRIRRDEAGAPRRASRGCRGNRRSYRCGQRALQGPREKTFDVVERHLPARAERHSVERMLRPRQFEKNRRRPGGAKLLVKRRTEVGRHDVIAAAIHEQRWRQGTGGIRQR